MSCLVQIFFILLYDLMDVVGFIDDETIKKESREEEIKSSEIRLSGLKTV